MSEWKECKLGDIAEVIDSLHKTPKYALSGYPMVRVTDVKKGRLNLSNTFKVDHDIYEDFSKKHKPQIGDVIFTRVGSYGNSCIVKTNKEFCLGQNTALIVPKENSDFLYYFLNSPDGSYQIESSVGGSTQPTISLESIKNFEIFLPPLPEQRAIASVLSSLDDKIDLLHRQNQTLEAMAETLFRQWFVEKADEGWEEGTLSDIANNARNTAKIGEFDSDCKYVALEHIERKNIALKRYSAGSDVSSNKYYFEVGDILFGKLRPYFHKVCFTSFSGICSTDILVIRPKNSDWFLFCLFAFFQNEVIEYANLGSGGTRMPRIDWKTLAQYPIAIPDVDAVKRFNEVVLPSLNRIQANLKQIRTLEKLRDMLLPKLMSGEVRVSI